MTFHLRIHYLESMKSFDVEVGNPPFSYDHGKTGKRLYPKFYSDALRRADICAFIMPWSPYPKSRKLRELLRRHVVSISENVSPMFRGTANIDVRIYVSAQEADRSRHPIPPELREPTIEKAMPERERINPITGYRAIRKDAPRKPFRNSTRCVAAVHKTGPVYVYVDNDVLAKAPARCRLGCDWAVLIGNKARVNGVNAVKVRCKQGRAFFSDYSFAVETRDEADADALLAWVTSKEFYALAKPWIDAYGDSKGIQISTFILKKLPMHRGERGFVLS